MDNHSQKSPIRVFYDAACPGCVKDRAWYEKRVGQGEQVEWLDINSCEQQLKALGIDPRRAMLELHVQDESGQIWRELPAYQILLSRLPRYRLLARIIGLPLIKPMLSWLYRKWVRRRLKREGRL
jgi:predicted DCC family thiol-disulfide oxidoreductase YuxK